MGYCKQHCDKNIIIIGTCTLMLFLNNCYADGHYIQIDYNSYPKPAIPPPLSPVEVLPQPVPRKELTPVELMVDLTNDLTYRILHYHSLLNRNSFAFSPTALMSILVVLYEGTAGHSALELKNVLQFPSNKDILRVGYRDIHRRLRTYFFGSENPLKGLSLNKDNVTITREYETILMFYGYDLGMDMVSSIATNSSGQTMPTTVEMSATTSTPSSDSGSTTKSTKETTTLPSVIEETITPTIAEKVTTINPETTTESSIALTTPSTEKPTTSAIETSIATEEPTTSTATEPDTETTEASTTIEPNSESEIVNGDEAVELISTGTGQPFLRIQKPRVTQLPSGRLQAPPLPQTSLRPPTNIRLQAQPQLRSKTRTSMRLTETQSSNNTLESALKTNYLPVSSRTFQSERISLRQGRQKRHLGALGSLREIDANLFLTLFHSSPAHDNLYSLSGPGSVPSLPHFANEFGIEVEPQLIIGPSANGVGPTEAKQNYNTDIISHIFYLGSQDIIYTTYKVYNAVLYYKYFDHLKMSVLELELDSPEYNLMILLPDYHTDLVTAAASLRSGPTLRLLRKQLKPRWVQAIIPDFRLHGTMFLTNDLQNFGICDLFEPNRADFRPMTDQKGIYVKHIEQSINVNIRTHPINQLRSNYGASELHPIQISVNHPFLFFVIDRDLDVAVMAGRILNPLNVRIQ